MYGAALKIYLARCRKRHVKLRACARVEVRGDEVGAVSDVTSAVRPVRIKVQLLHLFVDTDSDGTRDRGF